MNISNAVQFNPSQVNLKFDATTGKDLSVTGVLENFLWLHF
jgi:hypothetical protein